MSAAEIVAFLTGLAKAAEETPELISAVKGFIVAFEEGRPLTPALKYAEAVAMAKSLGLDPSKV